MDWDHSINGYVAPPPEKNWGKLRLGWRNYFRNFLLKKGDIVVFQTCYKVEDIGPVVQNNRLKREIEYIPSRHNYRWMNYPYIRKATQEECFQWMLEQ